MPTPRATTVDEVLKKSPVLINETALKDAFPTDADKAALLALSQKLHDATTANDKAAKAWEAVGNAKNVAVKLIGLALGHPL